MSKRSKCRGHIIDSLILPKVLDLITAGGGASASNALPLARVARDPSHALLEVRAATAETLAEILAQIADHGAVPTALHNARLVEADLADAFPEGFYSTTNQRTEVRLQGHWIGVAEQEMDCGIVVDRAGSTARCIPMTDVEPGMPIVVGHAGVHMFPEERKMERQAFEFIDRAVSTEKPKGVAIRQIAEEMHRTKQSGGKTLLVGGPAIVHTGSGPYVCQLIREGYIQRLFAGNALATHDIEQSLFGTSLGVHLKRRRPGRSRARASFASHQSHSPPRWHSPRGRAGGPDQRHHVRMREAQSRFPASRQHSRRRPASRSHYRFSSRPSSKCAEKIRDITFCLMIATTLHSVAVGNLLPAWVKVVCVDINPSTVIKLNDRGSFQTVGLVTDVEPFLRALVEDLEALQTTAANDSRSNNS